MDCYEGTVEPPEQYYHTFSIFGALNYPRKNVEREVFPQVQIWKEKIRNKNCVYVLWLYIEWLETVMEHVLYCWMKLEWFLNTQHQLLKDKPEVFISEIKCQVLKSSKTWVLKLAVSAEKLSSHLIWYQQETGTAV